MNTKQLWNALVFNEITEPYFDGIFPKDMLKNIEIKPKLIICNTDPSYEKGEHWILFFFIDNHVEYYDPLGKNIWFYGEEFYNFVFKHVSSYSEVGIRTQPRNSDLCGQYCLYYALLRCKGYSVTYIIESMISSPQKVLDLVKENFCFCKKSKCSLLHSCKKK